MDGKEVRLRGVNWPGMESAKNSVDGLGVMTFSQYMQIFKQCEFNIVRLTLSYDFLLNMDTLTTDTTYVLTKMPEWQGIKCGQWLEIFLTELAKNGIIVWFSLLSFDDDGNPPLWYTKGCPEDKVFKGLVDLAKRCTAHPNVMGFELKSEPHYEAKWGNGDTATDFALANERVGDQILAVNPNVCIIVSGITLVNWGDYISPAAKRPVQLSMPDKAIYTPHTYGPADKKREPEQYLNETMGEAAQANLPMLIGEYGWDDGWAPHLIKFCTTYNISNTVYWSILNYDDHWMLDNSFKPKADILELIKTLSPNPTKDISFAK